MRRLLLVAFALLAALYGLYLGGYRLNVTPSLPRGIYLEAGGQPTRGDFVSFCLAGPWAQLAKERGYLAPGACDSGLRPLLKQVAALPGDDVFMTSQGIVTVSGSPDSLLSHAYGLIIPQSHIPAGIKRDFSRR